MDARYYPRKGCLAGRPFQSQLQLLWWPAEPAATDIQGPRPEAQSQIAIVSR